MALVGDMVVQTANSPGTGSLNLIAAPAGRSSFVAQAGAGQVYYFIEDSSSWEKGVGTATAGSPDTLSRDTVLGNSLSTTARINFTGAVTVICDIPAERSIWASPDNSAVLIGNRRVSNVGTATNIADAARLDQVGLVSAGTATAAGGVIVVPLPNTTDVFRIDLRNVVPSAAAAMYLRVSVDGGATFLSGSSEYSGFIMYSSGSTALTFQQAASYGQMSQSLSVFSASGYIEVDPVVRSFAGGVNSINSINLFSGYWSTGGTPTHLLIGPVGTSFSQGLAKLTRRVFS